MNCANCRNNIPDLVRNESDAILEACGRGSTSPEHCDADSEFSRHCDSWADIQRLPHFAVSRRRISGRKANSVPPDAHLSFSIVASRTAILLREHICR